MKEIPSPLKAIIGLGNPGPRFVRTRHNAGFLVVDALADRYGGTWIEKESMLVSDIVIGGANIRLIKPQTFMNDSGKVITLLTKQGISPDTVLVVHDEIEKPFGTITFKEGGSHRGHNGLRSLIAQWGSDFRRLRFGVGRPERKEEVPEYVLMPFAEPSAEVEEQIDRAVGMIEQAIK